MTKSKKILTFLIFISILFNISNKITFCEELLENTESTQQLQTSNNPVFNKRDEKTGVWVIAASGVYPFDAELRVNEIKPDSNEYQKIISGLDSEKAKNTQRLSIYDIEILKDGKDIELHDNQVVIVRIPIPYDFDKNEIEALSIIYGDNNDINLDGAITQVDGKSYFEFTTNNLKQFKNLAIIDTKSTFMTVIVFIIVITIAGLILILANKNKKHLK